MYYVCMIYGIWSKQFLSDKIRYLKSDMSKLPKGYKIYRNRICHARVLIDNGYRQFSERSEQGQKSRFKPLQTSDFYYCNLKLSDYGNMNRYPYAGYNMRSKNEILFATVLDKIGLAYKYEPVLRLGDREICPDFAVRVPERGGCLYFEVVGMLDDKNYRRKFHEKFDTYIDAGFVPGEDVVFVYFGSNWTPDEETLIQIIVSAVEKR